MHSVKYKRILDYLPHVSVPAYIFREYNMQSLKPVNLVQSAGIAQSV